MADETGSYKMRRITTIATILFLLTSLQLTAKTKMVVDKEFKGDFKTLQGAFTEPKTLIWNSPEKGGAFINIKI